MNKRIEKVAYNKAGGLVVSFYEMKDGGKVTSKQDIQKRPLRPLKEAIAKLTPHLIIYNEQNFANHSYEALQGELYDINKNPTYAVMKFEVNGVSFTGDGDHSGCVIIGSKELATGDCLNMNTPNIKFFSEDASYKYGDNLAEICDEIKELTERYVDGEWDNEGMNYELFPDYDETKKTDDGGDGDFFNEFPMPDKVTVTKKTAGKSKTKKIELEPGF